MSAEIAMRTHLRQIDSVNPMLIPPITIIGCGATGSVAGVLCGKMGAQMMHLWDGDTIEEHNISNQMFPNEHLGRNKAEALKEEIVRYSPSLMMPMITAHDKMFEEGDVAGTPIVFLLVDGQDNRKLVFEELLKDEIVEHIIETKVALEYFEVWYINPKDRKDVEAYRESLEGETMEEVCTNRTVIYTIGSVAGKAVSIVKKIMHGEPVPKRQTEDLRNYSPNLRVWRWD